MPLLLLLLLLFFLLLLGLCLLQFQGRGEKRNDDRISCR